MRVTTLLGRGVLGLTIAGALGACSAASERGANDERALTNDALTGDAADCANVALDLTRAKAAANLQSLVSAFRASGSPAASGELYDNGNAWIGHLRSELPPGPTMSARVIAFLEGRSSTLFPRGELVEAGPDLVGSDYEPTLKTAPNGNTAVTLARRSVGGTAARFAAPALQAQLSNWDGPWRFDGIVLWLTTLSTSAAEAHELARCTPSEAPPVAGTLARPIELTDSNGLECRPFERVYVPNSRDTVAVLDESRWVASMASGRWQIRRHARLTIDPSNYWANMEASHCMCAGVATMWLRIDSRTGAVLSADPSGCDYKCAVD